MTRAQLTGTVADPLLTTRQAAAQLGVSLRTIQLWVEAGRLACYRTVGGHRRIHQSAVDALKASLKRHELAELLQKPPAPMFGGLNPKLATVAADVLRTGLLSREGVGVLLQEAEGETYSVAFAHGLTAQDLLSEAEAGRLTLDRVFRMISSVVRAGAIPARKEALQASAS